RLGTVHRQGRPIHLVDYGLHHAGSGIDAQQQPAHSHLPPSCYANTVGLTRFRGFSPRIRRDRSSATRSAPLKALSRVAPAMWGVATTREWESRGWLSGNGSGSYTSSAAPDRCPCSSAS